MTITAEYPPGPDGTLETRHTYTLFGEIASGGMATIRLGRQTGPHGLSRMVAVKKLHARCADDKEFVSMFRDEVRLAGRVIHPNVVRMLDVVAVNGELLLVMDYVHGESVARLAKLAHVTMPPEIASTIMVGVLHGLHAAHEARSENGEPLRLIHRDVTPHNVMVGVDGMPRLLDFGIAHAIGRMQTTRFGQVKGKLAYMAPEQVAGESLDVRVDVYSAAVTLWEMLAGRKLFDGRRQEKLAQMILSRPVERPGLFHRGIPPELDAIVLRGLQRQPDLRFSSAREMAIALEQRTKTVSATVMGDWVAQVWGEELAIREREILDIERDDGTSFVFPRPGDEREPLSAEEVGNEATACTMVLQPPARAVSATNGRALTAASAADYVADIQDGATPTGRGPRRITWTGMKQAVPVAAVLVFSLLMTTLPEWRASTEVPVGSASAQRTIYPDGEAPAKASTRRTPPPRVQPTVGLQPLVTMLPPPPALLAPARAPALSEHAAVTRSFTGERANAIASVSPNARKHRLSPGSSTSPSLSPSPSAPTSQTSRLSPSRPRGLCHAMWVPKSGRPQTRNSWPAAAPARRETSSNLPLAEPARCDPPFVIDGSGIKRFKLACL